MCKISEFLHQIWIMFQWEVKATVHCRSVYMGAPFTWYLNSASSLHIDHIGKLTYLSTELFGRFDEVSFVLQEPVTTPERDTRQLWSDTLHWPLRCSLSHHRILTGRKMGSRWENERNSRKNNSWGKGLWKESVRGAETRNYVESDDEGDKVTGDTGVCS